MSEIVAPWTPGQVDALNGFQVAGKFHPFTCVNRSDSPHQLTDVLVATERGWVCPHCDYTQGWAHAFMVLEETR